MQHKSGDSKRIVISGYYGFDNFGDEAILYILIRELKTHLPDHKIIVLSKQPDKTALELGVLAVDRWNVIKVLKEIIRSEILISGGGSLLQDVTSRLTIYYYLIIIFLAQLFKSKTFIYSQGIGPINNKLSYITTKYILGKTNFLTVRDSNSEKLLNTMNLSPKLTSDPVWLGLNGGKQYNTIFKDYNFNDSDKILGINLRPWQGLGMLELQEFARIINKISLEETLKIAIMPLQHELDSSICNDFYNILLTVNPDIKVVLIENKYTPIEWDSFIINCKLIIAMRFHALICALTHKIELFGLSYDPKVENIMKECNASYCTIKQWREKELPELIKNWNQNRKECLTYNLNFNQKVNQARQTLLDMTSKIKELK